jgi:uncharacterized membrane protein
VDANASTYQMLKREYIRKVAIVNILKYMENSNQKNVVMAVLAYLGPLVIISYLVAKDDPFVKFHIRQGLVLFAIEVIVWFVGMVFWLLWPILGIINMITFVLSIIGIINAVQGNQKQLPIVGSYDKFFNI